MSTPFISVVAIARNEEKVIARFIGSIREHLGPKVEIVIVDTGSTDKTIEIARSLGAKVYEEGERFAHTVTEEEERFINSKFNDQVVKKGQRLFFFSDARNCADSYATGSWLISIDLHWVLTCGKNLENRLRKMPADVTHCSYTVELSQTSTKSIFSTVRIYRRNVGIWKFRIHEVFDAQSGRSVEVNEMKAAKISGEHHGYLPHLAYHYYFGNYDPKGTEYARMLFYFAREVFYNKEKYSPLALELLRKCAHNKSNWLKERSQAAVFMSDLETSLENKRKSLIIAVSLNPIWREPYLLLANIAYNQCDWPACIGYAEQALKIKGQEGALHAEKTSNYSTEPYRFIYISLIQMARICRQTYYYDRAIERVEQALQIEDKTGCGNETFLPLWKEGYRCYKMKKDKMNALRMFNKCKNAFPDQFKREEDI